MGLMMGPRVIRVHSKFVQGRGTPDSRSLKDLESLESQGSGNHALLERFEHSEAEICSKFPLLSPSRTNAIGCQPVRIGFQEILICASFFKWEYLHPRDYILLG